MNAPEPAGSPDPTEQVRVAVYQHFATTGNPPTVPELAAHTRQSEPDVRHALRALHERHDLVLDRDDRDDRDDGDDGDDGDDRDDRDDRERIVMAHPFASVPLGFSVMGTATLWWGGCAWDSFALPHLLTRQPDVLVATRCPACDTPHAWVVDRHAPPAGSQVAHFLTPVDHIWDDVVHTCANQRLFCSTACVEAWLHTTGQQPGYVMDLPTLWRLARHWYAGRLDPGYTRRDPSTAAAYFAEVGLRGPFWGLSDV